jgi:hypothetical protein
MWNSLFGKKDAGLNEEDVKKEEEKTAEFKTYAQAKEAEQTHAETAPETPRKSYVATYHERWASTFPDLQSKLSPIARVMLNESSARELDRFLAAFCEYGTWGHRFEESVRDGLEIYERYLTSAAENEPRYGSSEEERTKWEGEAKKQIDRQVSPHTVAAQAQVEELLGLLEKAAESTRSGSHSGLKLEIKKACDRVSEMYTQNRPTFRQASSSIRAVKVALPSLEERIADLERFFDKPQSGSTHLQEFVCREMMGFLKAAVKLLQSVGHAVQFVEKMWSEAKHLRHVVYLAAKDAYEYAAKETGHSRGSLDQDENDVRIDSNPADAKMAGWSLI